jgi:hypothetical protein
VLIGIGFPFLDRDEIPGPTRLAGERDWATSDGFFRSRIRRAWLSAVYIVFNSYIVIVTFLPPYQNPDETAREIKGWVYTAAVGGTILSGFLYYWAAFSNRDWSLFMLAQAKADIDVKDTHDATYGCRKYVKVTVDDPVSSHQGRHLPSLGSADNWFYIAEPESLIPIIWWPLNRKRGLS